ncbi:VOC family protein [Microbacteriaceae bacterium VKM Ac-2855]|nr:VOC family protein [Microbacteriaceae bacterium VKM Ac-2855]
MGTVSTFLWYDGGAGEAADFYTSLLPNSRVLSTQHTPDGAVFLVSFELDGQHFQALNAGPHFHFTEAISISVSVQTQHEIDRLWAAIIADGGEESMCGWAKDRWGLSWQIVPTALAETTGGPDPEGAARATQAMFQMRKLDIAALRSAYAGE